MSFLANALDTQAFFRTISIREGLPALRVNAIVEAYDGFIWIGTTNGLCRYDGLQMKVFRSEPENDASISSNHIVSLSWLDGYTLIIGYAENGWSMFDTRSYKAKHFNNSCAQQPTEDATMSISVVDSCTILIGVGNRGLDVYDLNTQSLREFPLIAEVNDELAGQHIEVVYKVIQADHDPDLMWVCSNRGLLLTNKFNGKFTSYLFPRSNGNIHYNIIRDIHLQSQGVLWLATWGAGLMKLEWKTRKWDQYLPDPMGKIEGTRNIIVDLASNKVGFLWVASQDLGLGFFDMRSGQFEFCKASESSGGSILPGACNGVFADLSGRVWAFMEEGISLWHPEQQHFRLRELQTPILTSAPRLFIMLSAEPMSDSNNFLIGSWVGDGLYLCNKINSTCRIVSLPVEFRGKPVSITCISGIGDENYLLGTLEYGLFLYDHNSGEIIALRAQTENSAAPGMYIRSIIKNNERYFILNSSDGIFEYLPETQSLSQSWKKNSNLNNYKAQGALAAMLPISSRKWLVADQHGLFEVDLDKKSSSLLSADDVDRRPGMGSINRMTKDSNGNFWIATQDQGLICLDKSFRLKFQLNETNGLSSNLVYRIAEDADGYIWSSTMTGLNIFDPANGRMLKYDASNGLSRDFVSGGLEMLPDHHVLLGTKGGFYTAHSRKVCNFYQKPARITGFYINEIAFDADYTASNRLKYDQNYVKFKVSDFSFQHPDRVRFQYILKGLEDTIRLTEAGQSELIFPRLKPGKYELKVWPEGGSRFVQAGTLPFVIKEAFWNELWFQLGIALLLLAGTLLFYFWRIKQIKTAQNLKFDFEKQLARLEMDALRSQMNPHFLFNALSSIRLFIQKNENKSAINYLNKFSSLIRMILDNSTSTSISLHRELEMLQLYIALEQNRFDHKFDFHEEIDPALDLDEIHIPPLLIQPFVENAIWHGLMHKEGKGSLSLKVERREFSGICISVIDDGIGRKKSGMMQSKIMSSRKSLGMKITDERIQAYNKLSESNIRISIMDLSDDKGIASGTRIDILLQNKVYDQSSNH